MSVIFDTSVYIAALRSHDFSLLLQRQSRNSTLWLSSVVLQELYAGVQPRGGAILEKLERDFERAKRILVPELSDWAQTGRVLARIGQKYGYEQVGRARLSNDALIAVSAARSGMTLVTANRRDFAILAEFCPLRWESSTG